VSRRDEVRELLAGGLTQAQAAARLGITQQRVSALVRGCTTGAVAPEVVQPPASPPVVQPSGTAQPVVQPPNTVQPPDEAAIRADERARATARIRPHWDAAQAEIAALRGRVAELEAGSPGLGSCPAHRVPLVPACPRCTPLEDS
jgi:hypothetical protein